MKVQVAGIVNESVTDGPGFRTTVFFQGCRHHCLGCHNPQTWAFNGGYALEIEELINQIPYSLLIKGITLSGGDPFYQAKAAAMIANDCRKHKKDVWAYTGFTWEELMGEGDTDMLELLKACDVLVDGPFEKSLMCFDLPFRGSSNQRLISVQDSLRSGKVIEICLED
ncbi:MAG: anaerobic ribonucleoside-triphosphate reductase activating protein [Anaerolinea sp.]|nr:anaerobic ribonucleoside-triphosphate reductase activating protein [Anaerolinea sp.]